MSHNSNILYLNFIKNAGISYFLQEKPNCYYKIKDNKIKDIAINDISEITNLENLNLFINKSHKLKNNKFIDKVIIGEGYKKAKILIIGEFSEEEDRQIKPFKAESKKLLNKMLNAINLKIDETYLANIIPTIVENKNKVDNKIILEYLPFIQRQIEIINPKIIILMGSLAAKAILNSNLKIDKLRGSWHKYKSINLSQAIDCLVTYHPNHLLKFPKDKSYSWDDLKLIKIKLQNEYQ